MPRRVRRIRREPLRRQVSDREFLAEIEAIASEPHACILLSGGEHECSRYSLAGWDPFLCLEAAGKKVSLRTGSGIRLLEGDPFAVLEDLLSTLAPDESLDGLPFAGGAMGYLAYELKNHLEELPRTVVDDLGLPEMYLVFPRNLLIHDRRSRTVQRLRLEWDGDGGGQVPPRSATGSGEAGSRQSRSDVDSNFTREAYHQAVHAIREYIRAGDVYQVNLSRRFTAPFEGCPFRLWKRFHEADPAPFYAYVNGGDHQVLSTSMERFLHRTGTRVQTRPIKGTRRRGDTSGEDRLRREELLASPKDDAELSMIVDLLRNDLSRVCLPGSVEVLEHRRIETYRNVHHLVSVVEGELLPSTSHVELLRATFPGGSITGCPKIRAMEIIDELEPSVRHAYTGAAGYLGWHGNLDLSIAIRTAIVRNGRCIFQAGGGVVYDSDEESEYQETRDKARTFLQQIRRLQTGSR